MNSIWCIKQNKKCPCPTFENHIFFLNTLYPLSFLFWTFCPVLEYILSLLDDIAISSEFSYTVTQKKLTKNNNWIIINLSLTITFSKIGSLYKPLNYSSNLVQVANFLDIRSSKLFSNEQSIIKEVIFYTYSKYKHRYTYHYILNRKPNRTKLPMKQGS